MVAKEVNHVRQLLVIAHGHPRWSIGGGENAAYAIHQAFSQRRGWRSCYLAAAPSAHDHTTHDFPICWPVAKDQEWLMRRTEDWLMLRRSMRFAEIQWLKRWCLELNPDVVHVHHLLGVGLDVLLAMRQWLPNARIVFTLHEFMLLCPFRGQLLRRDGRRCERPTLEECSRCLPEISASRLWLRQRWIQTLLRVVDFWIAPSDTLRTRFLDHGLSEDRICVVDNLSPSELLNGSVSRSIRLHADRWTFGYFGAISMAKGLDILLQAFIIALKKSPRIRLQIHGPWPPDPSGCTDPLDKEFRFRLLLLADQLGDALVICGPYAQEHVLERMAGVSWVVMASRWLENSPVVIQEARLCGRPVLVPGIGGMAEKVQDGINGIHYPVDDPESLASLILRCSSGAYDALKENVIAESHRPDQSLLLHEKIYSGSFKT